jgi:hypothetical protein
MKCGNCGAEIDVDAMTWHQRQMVVREMELANTRDRYQARREQPPLTVGRRGIRVRGSGFSPAGLAAFAAIVVAFLVFDDVKWHALFPVLVALFWLFSCWLDYANDRDAVKLRERREREP